MYRMGIICMTNLITINLVIFSFGCSSFTVCVSLAVSINILMPFVKSRRNAEKKRNGIFTEVRTANSSIVIMVESKLSCCFMFNLVVVSCLFSLPCCPQTGCVTNCNAGYFIPVTKAIAVNLLYSSFPMWYAISIHKPEKPQQVFLVIFQRKPNSGGSSRNDKSRNVVLCLRQALPFFFHTGKALRDQYFAAFFISGVHIFFQRL